MSRRSGRAGEDLPLGPAEHRALSGCPDPPAGGRRGWWLFWRSPPGQPVWARPVLLAIAAAAAALYAWNLPDAGFAFFYSTAVKNMSLSWKAFLYGAFDPAATITIDKLAGAFVPQALSARVFGFHPWSLALPQVAEGVVAVLVMYRVVRRWAGVVPGLLAAGIFAFTPIVASMFGHSMEDGALTVYLVLAADNWQRAVTGARLRSLVWAGAWVGAGFQRDCALALGIRSGSGSQVGDDLPQHAQPGSDVLKAGDESKGGMDLGLSELLEGQRTDHIGPVNEAFGLPIVLLAGHIVPSFWPPGGIRSWIPT